MNEEVARLRSVCRSLEKAEGRVADLRAQRDELVRTARAAGAPFADLIEATGLSRGLLDAIVRGKHSLRGWTGR